MTKSCEEETHDDELLFTLIRAAGKLGISEELLKKMTRDGTGPIPTYTSDRTIMFTPASLREYIAKRTHFRSELKNKVAENKSTYGNDDPDNIA